jgi:hypothetical protein
MMRLLTDDRPDIYEAVVVHLIGEGKGPNGEDLELCSGKVYEAAAWDSPNARVFCTACRQIVFREMRHGKEEGRRRP